MAQITLDMSTSKPLSGADEPVTLDMSTSKPLPSPDKPVTLDMSTSKPLPGASAPEKPPSAWQVLTQPTEKTSNEYLTYRGPAGVLGSTIHGFNKVAEGTIGTIKGIYQPFTEPETAEEKSEREQKEAAGNTQPNDRLSRGLTRMVKPIAALPRQIRQIPGAIHDINQSPDAANRYLGVVGDTASQGAGQALVALGAHGLPTSVDTVKPLVKTGVDATKTIIDSSRVPAARAAINFEKTAMPKGKTFHDSVVSPEMRNELEMENTLSKAKSDLSKAKQNAKPYEDVSSEEADHLRQEVANREKAVEDASQAAARTKAVNRARIRTLDKPEEAQTYIDQREATRPMPREEAEERSKAYQEQEQREAQAESERVKSEREQAQAQKQADARAQKAGYPNPEVPYAPAPSYPSPDDSPLGTAYRSPDAPPAEPFETPQEKSAREHADWMKQRDSETLQAWKQRMRNAGGTPEAPPAPAEAPKSSLDNLETELNKATGARKPAPGVPIGEGKTVPVETKVQRTQFEAVHGPEIHQAIASEFPEVAVDLQTQLHGISNAELGDVARNQEVIQGTDTVSRAKQTGGVSRPEVFKRLLNKLGSAANVLKEMGIRTEAEAGAPGKIGAPWGKTEYFSGGKVNRAAVEKFIKQTASPQVLANLESLQDTHARFVGDTLPNDAVELYLKRMKDAGKLMKPSLSNLWNETEGSMGKPGSVGQKGATQTASEFVESYLRQHPSLRAEVAPEAAAVPQQGQPSLDALASGFLRKQRATSTPVEVINEEPRATPPEERAAAEAEMRKNRAAEVGRVIPEEKQAEPNPEELKAIAEDFMKEHGKRGAAERLRKALEKVEGRSKAAK